MSTTMPDGDGCEATLTLLVVDDDVSTRMMTRAFLERAGFAIEEAGDGAEALRQLEAVRPDLILLDVDMPVMDGFETCQRLRSLEGYRHVPVLMLTGLDNDQAISRAYEVGATDFASKPINWSLLCHRLRYMLRASGVARELDKSRSGLAAAQQIARLGDWELNPATGEMRWSDELYRILGRVPGADRPTLAQFTTLTRASDMARFEAAIEEARDGSGRASLDMAISIDDRSARHVRQDIVRSEEVGARGLRLRGVVQDFTERRRSERRIQQLAFYDALTRLPNRVRFNDTLTRAVAKADGVDGRGGIAVLYLDLDDFKRINDTLGHAAGDALLQQAARRLAASVQTGQGEGARVMAARMGGDEFTVLVTGVDEVERLQRLAAAVVEALSAPFELRGQAVVSTPSVGIALHDGSLTPEGLLRNAEQAMYAAKRDLKGSIRVHDESMDAETQRTFAVDVQLRGALERKELAIHYQPQLDLRTGDPYACEALLRWNSTTLGPIAPDEFIPLAEENGCILEIGAWVLEQACRDAMSWSRRHLPIAGVAVNVSVLQFMQTGFVSQVSDVLARTGLEPHRLELEITESLLATDTESAVATLKALKRIGVTLSIDDFGTGYSSLSQIKHFPIDRIKIDRSFVQDLDTDPQNAAIARAVIAMGRSLGLRVLAEGVETEAHLSWLIEAGCDEIQGYWLGRPRPARELGSDLERIDALLRGLDRDWPAALRKAG